MKLYWLVFIISIAIRSILANDNCINSITESQSISNYLEILKDSGKGISEVGRYNECIRKNNSYYILASGASGNTGIAYIGVCIPKACDINSIQSKLKPYNISIKHYESAEISFFGFLYVTFVFLFFSLTIFCTLIDSVSIKYRSNFIVSCFSAHKTVKNLFTVRENNKLSCINSLKVLSFAWVIYGHCFTIKSLSPLINLEIVPNIGRKKYGVLAYAGFFSVDIFFFIGGFLMAYFLLKEFSKTNGKISWSLLYLHRIIRIIPTYAFLIGFLVFVFPLLGSGPVFDRDKQSIVEACQKYWWTNLLFVNNFFPDWHGNDCFGIGWYLANDMQFFLIGPVLVYFYFHAKNKNTIWVLFSVLLILQTITTYYVCYYENLRVAVISPENAHWFSLYYSKPYCRIGVYLQGIVLAVILISHENSKYENEKDNVSRFFLRLVKKYEKTSAILGIFIMVLFVMIQKPVYDDPFNGDVWSRSTNAFVLAIFRIGFILGMSLFLLPALLNQSLFYSKILAHRVFEPLAKITYCGFLIHFFVLDYFYTSQLNTIFSGIYIFRDWTTFLPIVVFLAFFLHVFVEVPFQNLEKLLLHSKN